jgi:ubiquinone/menaquinone biosynthesis C-methylase UbiE
LEELFYKIFESLPRQGPGDAKSLQKAYKKLQGLPAHPNILDVGCGTGGQTLMLASISGGNITAIDNHRPFIEILKKNAAKAGYKERIKCIVKDMKVMDFAKESFDLIWCEGAAYFMGIGNALSAWKPFLRTGGYIVISELVWFKKEVPAEIRDYFENEYPEMKYYSDIFPVVENSGYKKIAYFAQPGQSWWDDYYLPIMKKIEEISPDYYGDKNAKEVFDIFLLEMDMHRKYSEFYGYGFYIMRKE